MDSRPPSPRSLLTILVLATLALGGGATATPLAVAQSAGDEQYADPLGPGGGDGADDGQQAAPDVEGDETGGGTPTPAPAPDASAESSQAAPGAGSAETLPRTGGHAGPMLGLGLALLVAGVSARRSARLGAR